MDDSKSVPRLAPDAAADAAATDAAATSSPAGLRDLSLDAEATDATAPPSNPITAKQASMMRLSASKLPLRVETVARGLPSGGNAAVNSAAMLRALKSPALEVGPRARRCFFVYNDGASGRPRHASVQVRFELPPDGDDAACAAFAALIGRRSFCLRYDLTTGPRVLDPPLIVLSERWSDTAPDAVVQEQRPDSYTVYREAALRPEFRTRADLKAKMCAAWRHKQDYRDEGVDADLGGGSAANNNCATFAAEFFEMIAEPEESVA